MNQLDFGRQEFFQVVFHDGMGLAAADFHNDPGPGDHLPDGFRQFFNHFDITIFLDVFQDSASFDALLNGADR